MKFGVCVPNYGASSSAEAISAVALEAERLGYDSVWTTDHLLMPRNSGTPYERIFDSIATLAFIAPQTKKVRLGISSLIIAMRNPVAAAKQLATVDAFSGGRLLLAIGVGWNQKEFTSVGKDFHDRGRRVDDTIRLLRSLWKGHTSFRGKWIPQRFDDAVFDPRRASGELEIWIGGTSEAAMRRAATLGDAWHPNVFPLETFRSLVGQFRESSPMAKSKPIHVRIGIDTKAEDSEFTAAQGDRHIRFTGDMDANARVVSELEELGVSYAILVPNSDGKTPIGGQVKSIGAFAERFVR